ncbi:interleukin-36 alpha-like isoform X2 [Sciurus carolinensis]|uniref:interleukin-36 alpha-like isoform X2 n=1 Tax=Sciurus carolinensis TaxID=30640 RepID=UPI001FB36365|nr:interleukin-36 alpha-like isoform X2 [Sciurus carolinensis]
MHKALSSEVPSRRYVQDLSHRVWVLQGQTLVMVPRKERMVPITVTLMPCKHLETLEKDRGMPMYLGLLEPSCCLCCKKDGEQPALQLEKRGIKTLHDSGEPVKPFLFYHSENGRTSTFESVAFPGWFIAACSKGDCPLFMTQELGTTYVTDFELIGEHRAGRSHCRSFHKTERAKRKLNPSWARLPSQ